MIKGPTLGFQLKQKKHRWMPILLLTTADNMVVHMKSINTIMDPSLHIGTQKNMTTMAANMGLKHVWMETFATHLDHVVGRVPNLLLFTRACQGTPHVRPTSILIPLIIA